MPPQNLPLIRPHPRQSVLWFRLLPQPQDFLVPATRLLVDANVVFPQSHLHCQTTFLPCLFWVGLTAVSIPNLIPVRLRGAPIIHPHEAVLYPVSREVGRSVFFPQSQRHLQTTAPLLLTPSLETTNNIPNFIPSKFLVRRHPQPFCFFSLAVGISISLPHWHLQSHKTDRVVTALRSSFLKTVKRPNCFPVRSTELPILCAPIP